MLILGIESSCDDTAAAVLENNLVKSSVLSSQDQIHNKFGGVVPELASRQHLRAIYPIVMEALKKGGVQLSDIDLIAATQGPGLVGSLLVGFSFAKALSYVKNIPLVGVNHMAGHILSVFLGENTPKFPYIALIVSGGTSSLFLVKNFLHFELLGRTRDDAAGEAFDKVAKLLGLPYPGGPHISQRSLTGDPKRISFPRAWLSDNSLDFSFSGLKTAVLNHCNQQKQKNIPLHLDDISASFQEAVVDVLVEKTLNAARLNDIKTIVLGGGVSANNRLREVFIERCRKKNILLYIPEPVFCTDNAAMIGLAGYHIFTARGASELNLDVYSRSQNKYI